MKIILSSCLIAFTGSAFAKGHGGANMEIGSVILLIICAIALIPITIMHVTTFTRKNAIESQQNMVIDTNSNYHVVWHKHNGGFIRSAVVEGSRLKIEVEKTFNRSKDTYIFSEFGDGYRFMRLSMQGGNRMRQKFGFITAKRIS